MKPEYEKVPQAYNNSFVIKIVDRPQRPTLKEAWHYHPELEICLTTKSKGRKFVGNVVSEYKKGDLSMFGKNLPHGYLTDMPCHQIVLQFTPSFLGSDIMQKTEFLPLQHLFDSALKGIQFSGSSKKKAVKKITNVIETDGLTRIIHFLDLLNILASSSTEAKSICKTVFQEEPKKEHFDRVKQVYDFIFKNYQKNISIRDVADLLCLTETSFCKFIKKHTKKTFSQIINETRIDFSCQLLIGTNDTIASISDQCGFNSTSYFNRTFRRIMSVTPQKYRAAYSETRRI